MKKKHIILLAISLALISAILILFVDRSSSKKPAIQPNQQADSAYSSKSPAYQHKDTIAAQSATGDTVQNITEDTVAIEHLLQPVYQPFDFNGAFMVRMDTLPRMVGGKYTEAEKKAQPIGVVVKPFYTSNKNDKDYVRFNSEIEALRAYLGGSRTGFDGWQISKEFTVVKTAKSTYLVNPDEMPVYGVLIATIGTEPVFYKGADLDLVNVVNTHFGISTKEEFQNIVRENIKLKQAYIKSIYDNTYLPSSYSFTDGHIKLLNEYIIKYALELKMFTVQPELELFFKGKVKHARVSFTDECSSNSIDTSVINLDFDREGRMIKYHKFDFGSPQIKQYYNFSYDSNGLIDSVTSNYTGSSYKVYAYNDKIQLVMIPYHDENLDNPPHTLTVSLAPNSHLPYEMDLGYGIKYIFEHDSQSRIESWQRTFNGESTIAKHLYKYNKQGLSTYIVKYDHGPVISYKYTQNKVEATKSGEVYIQTLKYDKQKNVTAATFDERTGWCETIDRFYKYEYY